MSRETRKLERLVKGYANHRRIEIGMLLERMPELSLTEIAEKLCVNFKTIAEHTRRLVLSGLVWKRNDGRAVRHVLSPRGKLFLKFLRTLE
jgi:DNA-binding MarR family transcriptional regulator